MRLPEYIQTPQRQASAVLPMPCAVRFEDIHTHTTRDKRSRLVLSQGQSARKIKLLPSEGKLQQLGLFAPHADVARAFPRRAKGQKTSLAC